MMKLVSLLALALAVAASVATKEDDDSSRLKKRGSGMMFGNPMAYGNMMSGGYNALPQQQMMGGVGGGQLSSTMFNQNLGGGASSTTTVVFAIPGSSCNGNQGCGQGSFCYQSQCCCPQGSMVQGSSCVPSMGAPNYGVGVISGGVPSASVSSSVTSSISNSVCPAGLSLARPPGGSSMTCVHPTIAMSWQQQAYSTMGCSGPCPMGTMCFQGFCRAMQMSYRAPQALPGMLCQPSTECTGGSICVAGVCTCMPGLEQQGTVCVIPLIRTFNPVNSVVSTTTVVSSPGQPCGSPNQCVSGAACNSGMCACTSSYQQMGRSCVRRRRLSSKSKIE